MKTTQLFKWPKDWNSHFTNKITNIHKHMKRHSTLLFTREMQIKTLVWYSSMPTTMTKILKDYLSIGEDMGQLEFSCTVVRV